MIINPFIFAQAIPPFTNTKSIIFDGIDDYIDCGQPAIFDSTTNYSISTWFKTSSTATQGIYTYVPYTPTISNGWIELGISSTSFTPVICNGAITYGQTSTGASLSTWYNVVVVFNGGGATNADRLKIYINGVDTAMTFTGTIPSVTAKPFTGPDPKINKITAAINVVTLASITVILALL